MDKCYQTSIYMVDLSVSRSSTFSRHRRLAGRLRRLRPPLPFLLLYRPFRCRAALRGAGWTLQGVSWSDILCTPPTWYLKEKCRYRWISERMDDIFLRGEKKNCFRANGREFSAWWKKKLSLAVPFPGLRWTYSCAHALGVARRRRAEPHWTAFVLLGLEMGRQKRLLIRDSKVLFVVHVFLALLSPSLLGIICSLLRSRLVAA